MFERKEYKRPHHSKGQLQMGLGVAAILMILAYMYQGKAQPIVPPDFIPKSLPVDTVKYQDAPPPAPLPPHHSKTNHE